MTFSQRCSEDVNFEKVRAHKKKKKKKKKGTAGERHAER